MKKLLVFTLSILLLASCQATPEKEVVKQKNDDLVETIKSSEEENSNTSPAVIEDYMDISWDEYINTNGNEFNIKVSVNNKIPNVQSTAVCRIEPMKFTAEQFQSIKTNLYGDLPLYHYDPENMTSRMTKSQIEDKILNIQKSINDPNSEFNTAELSDEEYSQILKEKENSIKLLKKRFSSAPDEIMHKEIQITDETIANGIFGYIMHENGKYSGFYISPIDIDGGRLNSLSCTLPREEVYEYGEFSYEEALNCAEEFKTMLGVNDMTLDCHILNDEHGNYKSYQFIYTKEYDGINLTYTFQDIDTMSSELYTTPWRYEKLLLYVDNSGVFDVFWNFPSHIVETLSDSVNIIDIEKAKDIFKSQIQYKVVWDNDDAEVINKELLIDEVRLGMMRVNIKGSIDEYMVIPVYDFFGAETLTYTEQQPGGYLLDENNQCTIRRDRFSYLTINAIDGSIIDRSLGY